MGQVPKHDLVRRRRPEVEVVDFHSLPYLMTDEEDAFLLVLNPGGTAPELPVRRPPALRLRFHAPEGHEYVAEHDLRPFDSAQAEHVLRFVRRIRGTSRRIFVGSPDGEVRGPGLALGVADILRLPAERIAALESWYRWHSRAVRRAVWEAAHPPQPVAARPEVKAASGLLAFLSRYLSS